MQPIRITDLSQNYGKIQALDNISLEMPAGEIIGIIGPDGVGKSSLLSLISGARVIQQGDVEVFGDSLKNSSHLDKIMPRLAYMPQGLGSNLYPTLSIEENLQFFAQLFGQSASERRRRIDLLTGAIGLKPFLDRPAGKLSGGMKQKLGLCSALIHDPDLLILDEPTTGVDPLARAQFWQIIDNIRQDRPQMTVLVATAYMEEAQGFDRIVAMDDGKVLVNTTPTHLLESTNSDSLESAFIKLLPQEKTKNHQEVIKPELEVNGEDWAIEAYDLTKKFGDFTAVDQVSFKIKPGEIFGFLGSNGCGKTTTMKMLTGLVDATSGSAKIFGKDLDSSDLATRKKVGFMSQNFSLYGELTIRQNLELHAKLFQVPRSERADRVAEMEERFELADMAHTLPRDLPLGIRQRLSLAVAMVHKPSLLILDEPTSGVDPIARDAFWQHLIRLSREDKVTIFISTHFMNEAERCDRMSMMHAGKVLASDKPANLVKDRGKETLEDAFIDYLLEEELTEDIASLNMAGKVTEQNKESTKNPIFSFGRMLSYLKREVLELQRDPVRATLALVGSIILMIVIGYGISMDVDDLSYAVLDSDQTTYSQSYANNLAGSPYFIEKPPLYSYQDLDDRMQSGELSLAIEIPSGFGADLLAGRNPEIGAWIDGSMPQRAETVKGYVQGMHYHWLGDLTSQLSVSLPASLAEIETRFMYNPGIESMLAMVPGVIPMLLLMLPAMLTALAIVREKETGSITNFYVTPVTRFEFMLGKQLPYVALAMLNFVLMIILAVVFFDVPIKGSLATLLVAGLIYSFAATAIGLLASSVTKSQVAAMFFTMIGTMIPAVQFAGLIDPVSSLTGFARFVGEVYPASHMISITRGVFAKSLGFSDLYQALLMMLLVTPIIMLGATMLLRKQEK